MNLNRHLYLTETEKLDLATLITKTITEKKYLIKIFLLVVFLMTEM